MNTSAVISAGLVMGFSASLVCLGWCIPVIMPFAATSERPGLLSGLSSTFSFSLGRLVSYLGLMSLFLAFRSLVPLNPLLGTLATTVSGIILVLSGLSAAGAIKWSSGLGGLVCRQAAGIRSPLYLGVLTGLRPCGPLLAAMAFMLTLPTVLNIGVFMLCFWVASSALVMAGGIVGGSLSTFISGKLGINRLRSIMGMAMVFIGLFLLLTGIGGLGGALY
jgi:sulfite exporter TauE/SafE